MDPMSNSNYNFGALTCILPMSNPKRTSPRVATIMAKTISPT
jgi:hypothetical protein